MPTTIRPLIVAALCTAVLVEHRTGLHGLPVAHALPSVAAPAADGPCEIVDTQATTDRAAVRIGGTVGLTLSWRWRCAGGGVKRDVLIVADPSAAWAAVDPDGPLFLSNLRLALTSFADRVGFENGQRFGTVMASCPAGVSASLGTGEAAHRVWRDGLSRFPASQDRDMLGALALARDALAARPSSPGEPSPIVLVVDSGGTECGTGPQPTTSDYAAVCWDVRDTGATVALLVTRRSQPRMTGCNTPGWLFRSSNDRGTDLVAVLGEIADRMFVPDVPTEAFTRIAPASSDWDVVDTDPDSDAASPEIQWFKPVEQSDAGEMHVRATFRARADAETGPRLLAVEVTGGPSAGLTGVAGDLLERAFEAPPVCIYARGRGMAECGVREPIHLPFVVR